MPTISDAELDQLIVTRFPHPVALAYQRLLLSEDPRERALKIINLYEFTVRTLTLGIAQRYIRQDHGINSPEINKDLRKHLPMGYPGHWPHVLRKILEVYATQTGADFFMEDLLDRYRQMDTAGQDRFWEPFEELTRLGNTFKTQVSYTINRPIKVDMEALSDIANDGHSLLRQIARYFIFLTNYQMIYIRHLDTDAVVALNCTGTQLSNITLSRASIARMEADDLEEKSFYLLHTDKGQHQLLRLYPLIILDMTNEPEDRAEITTDHTAIVMKYIKPRHEVVFLNIAGGEAELTIRDPVIVDALDELIEGYLSDRIREEQRNLDWGTIHESCIKISAENSQESVALYNDRVYLKREAVSAAIDLFLQDVDTNALVITGDSGVGKSALSLWLLENINQSPDKAMIWYSGRNFQADRLIIEKLAHDLGQHVILNISVDVDLLRRLDTSAALGGKKLILFFDALNENANPSSVLNEIDTFVRAAARYPWLKIIITSRPQAWRTIRASRADKTVERWYYTRPGNEEPIIQLEGFRKETSDVDAPEAHPSIPGLEPIPEASAEGPHEELGIYNPTTELEKVYRLYQQEYDLKMDFGLVSDSMKELLRDPFALQMIARIYRGQNLPQHISRVDLVPKLIERLLSEAQQETEDVAYLTDDDIRFVEEDLVPLFFKGEQVLNSIPQSELDVRPPGYEGHTLHDWIVNDTPDRDNQPINQGYQRLERAGVLTLEGTRTEYFVRFRFERFYDYFVGRYLFKQTNPLPVQEKIARYRELTVTMLTFPYIWGPVHRALLIDLEDVDESDDDLILGLAPVIEGDTQNAPLMEDLLTEALIDFGSKNLEEVKKLCAQLLFEQFDSVSDRAKNQPHGYLFAISVANSLQLADILKRASDHHDEFIRNAVSYSAYVNYPKNPQLTTEIISYVVSKIWRRGFIINFSALMTAFTLSLLLGMSYYTASDAKEKRAELVAVWQPVIRRLPGGGKRHRVLGKILEPISRFILGLVIRFVVFRIGRTEIAEHKGIFSVPDADAGIPVPEDTRIHVDVLLNHYQNAFFNHSLSIDDLIPHYEAIIFNEREEVRSNLMLNLVIFAAMLPWIRRDPAANSRIARELFERGVALRESMMKRPAPVFNILVMSSASSSKPSDSENVALVLENYGALVFEFEMYWHSETFGPASTYVGNETGNYLSLYHRFTGSVDSPYIDQYYQLIVERRDYPKLLRLLDDLGHSGLADMENNPVKSAYVLQNLLIRDLGALRQMGGLPADKALSQQLSDAVVDAFINLKHFDPIGTIALLDEQASSIIDEVMKRRIMTARRSPKIGGVLGTVISWFASAATFSEDPMGRKAFANFVREMCYGRSLSDGLINFLSKAISGDFQ